MAGKEDRATNIDFPYLVELLKPKHKVIRVVWLLVFLTMIGISIYLIYLLIVDFRKFSSFNLISVVNVRNLTLPAITICSLSVINVTSVDDPKTLADYYALTDSHKKLNLTKQELQDRDGDDEALQIYTKNAMRIEKMILKGETTFGKIDTTKKEFKALSTFHFTELGRCMEINDDASLVQQVEGPDGGLVLVLDANIEHYLNNVETQGFYITLRMPKETIVTKNFGFTVSTGEEVLINIEKAEVERLGDPWGECHDTIDLFNSDTFNKSDLLTKKECFLLQKLWSYFRIPQCTCFPWYFWDRFLSAGKGEHDEQLSDRLLKYFTYDLPENKKIKFNKTCGIFVKAESANATVYEGNDLTLLDGIQSVKSCGNKCRNETGCVLFMYARDDNDYLKREQCHLFSAKTNLVPITVGKDVTGLYRGGVNCTGDLGVCGLYKGMSCEDEIMRNIMSSDPYYEPFRCDETCSYQDYRVSLSRSVYPARKYWDNYLSKTYTSRKNYNDAKNNFIKLVFYIQRMQLTTVTQTPSYEIQSFIGELGGLTDLFIGISFFTFFQMLDWLLTRPFRKSKNKAKSKANKVNSGHFVLEDV